MSSGLPGPEGTQDREIASDRTTLAPLDAPQDTVGNVVGNALATNDGGATVDVFAAIAADMGRPSPPPGTLRSEVDSPAGEDDGSDIYTIAARLASAIDRAIAAERWTLAERLQGTLDRLAANLVPTKAVTAKAKPRRPA